jgi:hypothetical protein
MGSGHKTNLQWRLTQLLLDVIRAHLEKSCWSPLLKIMFHPPSQAVSGVSQAFLGLQD